MNLGVSKSTLTHKIDKIVLNRFLGIPIFLVLIYLVFAITIQGGGKVQSLISEFLSFILFEKFSHLLQAWQSPDWVIALCTSGIGQGLHTVLCFVPVVASMFFCLAFLEATGYMARAALVMDKIMNTVGLSGKSFMPMILGFGCNVPAILGTRVLEDPKERILTILMTPFMSCGARLAIYALFVAAFFPENGANIIFALYMIGIFLALFTAWVLRQSLSKQEKPKALCIDLPTYSKPNIGKLLVATYNRVKTFVLSAGKIIIPLCVLIGSLGTIKTEDGQQSYMMKIARHLTPIFTPMGIKEENWPATLGLLSGLLAKEVMVGTLTALYAEPNKPQIDPPTSIGLENAHSAMLENNGTLNNPLAQTATRSSLGSLVQHFGGSEAAFAYLLFVLLYFPCVSVLATISRELNFSWAVFSGIWNTGLAYGVAVLFYQIATFSLHPGSSLAYILTAAIALGLGLLVMQKWAQHVSKKPNKHQFPTRIIILES